MLKNIRVVPLAAESFGVRSMCTYVETPDSRVLLDAGVSLAPSRFGMPPHPREFEAIADARTRIAEVADKVEIVTVSHYHFDHHTPSFEDWLDHWTEADKTARQIYRDKIVLVKNSRENVNFSQRKRGWAFKKSGGKYARLLEVADGKSFSYGKTVLKFSEAVPHGRDDASLGWVIMTSIKYEDQCFLFAPDVQGPMSRRTLDIILSEHADMVMLGGPPSYLAGFKVDEQEIDDALKNVEAIVAQVPTTILEHHLLRDAKWRARAPRIFSKAERLHHSLVTAAEFVGVQNSFLEANRNSLFSEHQPSKEFAKWMKLSTDAKKHKKPPL